MLKDDTQLPNTSNNVYGDLEHLNKCKQKLRHAWILTSRKSVTNFYFLNCYSYAKNQNDGAVNSGDITDQHIQSN